MRKILLSTAVFFFIAFVAVIGVFLLRSDDPDLATEAPLLPIPTAAADVTPTTAADVTPTTAAPTVTPTGTATLDLPARVRRFVIDPSGSSAKYVVKENLRLIETTAVGETTAISGEIYLSPDGLYDGATSSFTVDLRELKSDESRRDSYINRTTLDTSSFPFAEFVVESITGFPTDYVENTQVELTLSGSMTIHGVSQPMTFSVLARQAGNSLSAVADADFKMTDFGIEPPSVSIATAPRFTSSWSSSPSSPRLSSAGADGCLRMTEGIVLGALAPGAGQVLQAISCAVVDVLNAGFLLVAHKS